MQIVFDGLSEVREAVKVEVRLGVDSGKSGSVVPSACAMQQRGRLTMEA